MAEEKAQAYWYKYHWIECPVCGRASSSYKERVYTKKPDAAEKRHTYEQRYDYCLERGSAYDQD